MQIKINGKTVDLPSGMKVHHALTAWLQGQKLDADVAVTDRWGNLVGLDGDLSEGTELTIQTGANKQ
jgi:sulfur carrier protein ThiS